MTCKILLEKDPSSKDIQVLTDGITENARKVKGINRPIEFFAFFIRDENGQILGGCSGENMYGCSYVAQLWVTEALRGQGFGTKLMQAAEKFAAESSSAFLAVSTMDWEALDFYKKLGFHVEFERHGFEKDSVLYFLRKDLNSTLQLFGGAFST